MFQQSTNRADEFHAATGQTHASNLASAIKEKCARFLAVSAALDYDLLESRDETGHYQFRRGRQKYYGLGSLVIFFAVFSGYGMGHMLASMSHMSAVGAVTAGIIWGIFQWCLERQILISIRSDDVWFKKVFGFVWRAALALMSASVMVYPFFVESNRAEIDVKVGEIAQRRMLNSQASTEQIVNLPQLREQAQLQQSAIQKTELALAQSAPDIAIFKARAKQCWSKFQIDDGKWLRQIQGLKLQRVSVANEASIDSKISALEQKRDGAKASCASADAAITLRNAEWHQQKRREQQEITGQQRKTQQQLQEASSKRDELMDAQSKKILSAANSGFAADFFAVAELLAEDAYRRFQLLWWLSWFVAIELIAILIKFATQTELDLFLLLEEKRTVHQQQQEFRLWQERQTTDYLRTYSQHQAEQAVWKNQSEERAAEALLQQLELEHSLANECQALKLELAKNRNKLELGLAELSQINSMQQKATHNHEVELVKTMCDRARQELEQTYLKSLQLTANSA